MNDRLSVTFRSMKTECERVNRDCTLCNKSIKNVCNLMNDEDGCLIAPMFWKESKSPISTNEFHETTHGIGVDEE